MLSSMLLFDRQKTPYFVSFKPKRNKVVTLLSTMHGGMELNSATKKRIIFHNYNETKGAVDTLDKMYKDMSCSRKTRLWLMCMFYGMMNIAFINSYVISCTNNLDNNRQPLNRKDFMKKLCKELTTPHMRSRLNVPSLQKNIQSLICKLLGIRVYPEAAAQHGARETCFYCPSSLRMMTTNYCPHCNRLMCGQHR